MVQAATRPKAVTAVVALIVATAVFQLVSAVLQFIRADGSAVVLVSGALTLVIAAVYLLLAKGIADGREVARVIVAVASSLMVVVAIWGMFTQPSLWPALIIEAVLGMVVLAILYTERATAFFTRQED